VSDPILIPAAIETDLWTTYVKRHLIAAVLSTVIPGAGQFFLGKRGKAIVLFVILVALSVGFWPLRLAGSFPGLVFLAWMCLLLSLFAIFDALFSRDEIVPGRLSGWWILPAVALAYVGINLVFTLLLLGSGFRAMTFASSAMEPTLHVGERFVFDRNYYHSHPTRRDDLVVMRTQGFLTVKRIVAVSGDTIQGKEQHVLLNGQRLSESFIQHQFPVGTNPELDTFGPAIVPEGKYFVLGDNRDISLDSRTHDFGLVDSQSIVGKPLYAYRFRGHPHSRRLN
jgi:signal peptidase I